MPMPTPTPEHQWLSAFGSFGPEEVQALEKALQAECCRCDKVYTINLDISPYINVCPDCVAELARQARAIRPRSQ